MRTFILNSKNPAKSAYVWNTIAATSNSFQTMLLLLVITRKGNLVDASVFAIAYAVGNLMLSLGKYGMRNFQVTDVAEKYDFSVYASSRIVTGLLMLLGSVVYIGYGLIFSGYSSEKSLCMMMICLIKLIEVVEDVLHGRLQQCGRLDIASKILGIRMLTFIGEFILLYLFSGSLLLAEAICLVTMLALALGLNKIVIEAGYPWNCCSDHGRVFRLLKECFPLAASTFLIMYIGNAPKYIIDSVVNEEVQTCFNIIFMPVFVITLLSSFIFNPILSRVARCWEEKQYREFERVTVRQFGIIGVLTAAAIVFAYFAGSPLLGLIYKVELGEYLLQLCVLMLAGGLLASLNLLNMLITAIRRQKSLIWSFGAAAALMWLGGKAVLIGSGLEMLCVFYCGVLLLTGLVLAGLLIHRLRLEKTRKEEYACDDGNTEL